MKGFLTQTCRTIVFSTTRTIFTKTEILNLFLTRAFLENFDKKKQRQTVVVFYKKSLVWNF